MVTKKDKLVRVRAKDKRFRKYAKAVEAIMNDDPEIRRDLERKLKELHNCLVEQMIFGNDCCHPESHGNYWTARR